MDFLKLKLPPEPVGPDIPMLAAIHYPKIRKTVDGLFKVQCGCSAPEYKNHYGWHGPYFTKWEARQSWVRSMESRSDPHNWTEAQDFRRWPLFTTTEQQLAWAAFHADESVNSRHTCSTSADFYPPSPDVKQRRLEEKMHLLLVAMGYPDDSEDNPWDQ
jgi:hypothetical protein